ncbi:IS630 family transposase [Streptomyces brasiliscabiei]|uniref:IS630 family transposase n=1 Tax=Streptomyces brasiliscabiei TaxID=2736302 RepID=UPI003F68248F
MAAPVAGRTREDVAAVFQVSLKAVDNWWAKWLAGGREALVAQPRGRRVGEHQILGEVEQQAVRQAVLDHRPCDLGLAGQLWTRAGVGDLIAKLYQVRLTEPGVGKYLRRWGLSFQRPDERAVEQSPEAVRVWREETWPAIRAKAKAEGGEVLFADQVGIRSDQVTGCTWGARGCTPIVRRTGNRFSVNAMSAISTKGRMHFMVFTETFDADVMCRFLHRLAGHFDHKVHLVLDGHSAHRSRKVHDWLADHPDRIELHFLPLYSPELNPDDAHRPRLLRRPTRALHPRIEPFEFLINSRQGGCGSLGDWARWRVQHQYEAPPQKGCMGWRRLRESRSRKAGALRTQEPGGGQASSTSA